VTHTAETDVNNESIYRRGSGPFHEIGSFNKRDPKRILIIKYVKKSNLPEEK